jgi:hypothetical protein
LVKKNDLVRKQGEFGAQVRTKEHQSDGLRVRRFFLVSSPPPPRPFFLFLSRSLFTFRFSLLASRFRFSLSLSPFASHFSFASTFAAPASALLR